MGNRVCIREDCEWVPKGGHFKKNDFYEIFALIRYQFSQMPFQYLPTELYEIIVKSYSWGMRMWQTSAAWLREAQGMLLVRSTPGGCQAVSLPKAGGAGGELPSQELPTSGARPSPPPGMYPKQGTDPGCRLSDSTGLRLLDSLRGLKMG